MYKFILKTKHRFIKSRVRHRFIKNSVTYNHLLVRKKVVVIVKKYYRNFWAIIVAYNKEIMTSQINFKSLDISYKKSMNLI